MNPVPHIYDHGRFLLGKKNLLRMPHANDLAIHTQLKRAKRPPPQRHLKILHFHPLKVADRATKSKRDFGKIV